MARRELVCKIGEVRLGRGSDLLKATLGSCVGIGLIWRERERCALAHCLLAVAPGPTLEISAKYVSQAVPSLLALLKAPTERYSELEAIVVGGASMMGPDLKSGPPGVGRLNGDTALKVLKGLGIPVVHLDLGGVQARQVSIDCETHEYSVRVFEKKVA